MKKYATRKNPGRPSPKGGDGSGNGSKAKIKVLIIASVLSSLAYFIFMNKSPEAVSPPKVTAQAKKGPQEVVRTPEVVAPSETHTVAASMQKARARGLSNLVYGVKSLKLQEANGVLNIPFSFHSKKQWCVGGDLDTISLVVPDVNSEELLITLETLTSKTRGDKAVTSLRKLVDGFDKTFQIPLRNKTESLGLFICRDSSGEKSCLNKELKSHQDISNSIADNKTAGQALKKDYIFYFQSFIVKDGKLHTYKNESTLPEEVAKLKAHLNAAFEMKPEDFDASTKYNTKMRSVAASINSNKIELTLPYNDPRCLPGSKL